ncbi:MAG: oxygen-independent coproporphyrinogen III oxidase-like protein, partial [Thiomicrorhabdus sp.]|nr:oxygen-independent coproporphyrinogen III oxidase-like protein [Thiomicrorhabdus sp.]
GLGAGAHGKITMPPEGKIWRTQMPASPGGYIEEMKRPQPGRKVLVSEHDASFEFMLNALRLQDGFDLSLFEQRTGLPLSNIEGGVNIMQQKGWRMISEPNYLKLTTKGRHYLNDVVSLFL